jgi:hypothetical protein
MSMAQQIIRRGILYSFDPLTYTAQVIILEATSATLQSVPVATSMDGTSAIVGAPCAVLFFDEQNHADAVVIAVYPNLGQGVPNPAPGRCNFVTGAALFTSQAITSGSVFTATAGGSIPAGALGIIYTANYTSPTSGAYIQIGRHGAALGNYQAIGNLPAANAFLNGNGIVALDSSGKIDVKANGGNCTVSMYVQGFFI